MSVTIRCFKKHLIFGKNTCIQQQQIQLQSETKHSHKLYKHNNNNHNVSPYGSEPSLRDSAWLRNYIKSLNEYYTNHGVEPLFIYRIQMVLDPIIYIYLMIIYPPQYHQR